MAYENLTMTVPDIKWLGIQADDIRELHLQGILFSDNEIKRFGHLKARPYMKDHPWVQQIDDLKNLGIKVEIQSLHEIGSNFLLDVYLPYKIQYGYWK